MNRIDRISAILIHLQSRKLVRARDIADRFEISLRTVYRDVKSLETAGVPVIGEAGSGYSLMEGYRLPPIQFTLEEAMALNSAEKIVEKLTDDSNSRHFSTALFKVKAVLRGSEKEFLAGMENHIEVLKAKREPYLRKDLQPIQPILKATAGKRVVSINYQSEKSDAPSARSVEPVGIFYLDHYWHLIAWCRLRNDYRDFRFDRISELKVSEEKFTSAHPDIRTFLDRKREDQKLTRVTVRVGKSSIPRLADQKYYHGFISETNCEEPGFSDLQFDCFSMEGFARWYLMFADDAKIISPDSLTVRVRTLLAEISENI